MIGKKHDFIKCAKAAGGCNTKHDGTNIGIGWECPSNCRCDSNPAHMIDRHHIRVWKSLPNTFFVMNRDPQRRSAIKRNNVWTPMSYNKKEILQNLDQVALLYNEKKGPFLTFEFYM